MVKKSVSLFWFVALISASAAIFWSGVADESWLLSVIGYLSGFLAFGALLELFKKKGDSATVEPIIKELKAQGIPEKAFEEYVSLNLPDRVEQIIANYSHALAQLPELPSLHPVSILPYPKEEIRAAIEQALDVVKDQNLKSMLRTELIALNRFVPEHEIIGDRHKDLLTFLGIKK